jgi:hypothetical protein
MRVQQVVFRRGVGVTIDGGVAPSAAYEVGNTEEAANLNGPWLYRAPSWARYALIDACSAGAGGGADNGTVSGGGGCSGLQVSGYRMRVMPGELLTVRVGQGAPRAQAAFGAQVRAADGWAFDYDGGHTVVAGQLDSMVLGRGLSGASAPPSSFPFINSVPNAGQGGGAGGNWQTAGKAFVLGGAAGNATSPGALGQVARAIYPSGVTTNANEATATTVGASSNSRLPFDGFADSVRSMMVMAGCGGAPGGTGTLFMPVAAGGVTLENSTIGGFGGLCLPFTNWSTVPSAIYRSIDRALWAAWWTDLGAGYGRGGLGDSVGLDDGLPGGNGIAIVTFMETLP